MFGLFKKRKHIMELSLDAKKLEKLEFILEHYFKFNIVDNKIDPRYTLVGKDANQVYLLLLILLEKINMHQKSLKVIDDFDFVISLLKEVQIKKEII